MSNEPIGRSFRPVEGDVQLVADRLREAREYVGYSQDHVANAIGIGRSGISEIEKARRKVSAVELKAFARLYGRSIGWFTDEKSDTLPDEVAHLARTASELTQSDLNELQQFADFLKHKAPG